MKNNLRRQRQHARWLKETMAKQNAGPRLPSPVKVSKAEAEALLDQWSAAYPNLASACPLRAQIHDLTKCEAELSGYLTRSKLSIDARYEIVKERREVRRKIDNLRKRLADPPVMPPRKGK